MSWRPTIPRRSWTRAWSLRLLYRTETLNALREMRLRHGADLYKEALIFDERGHAVRVLDEFDQHVREHGPVPDVCLLVDLLDNALLHEEADRHAAV